MSEQSGFSALWITLIASAEITTPPQGAGVCSSELEDLKILRKVLEQNNHWFQAQLRAEQADRIAAAQKVSELSRKLTELMTERDEERKESVRELVAVRVVRRLDQGRTDANVRDAGQMNDPTPELLRLALKMLAAWCVAVDRNGSGWDDWDEHYKDARYRPGPLRALLDAAIAEEQATYE